MIRLVRRVVLSVTLLVGATARIRRPARRWRFRNGAHRAGAGHRIELDGLPCPESFGGTGSYGNGVSCVTSTFCIRSGSSCVSSQNQALDHAVERLVLVGRAEPEHAGSTDTILSTVSCTSTSFCVAGRLPAATVGAGALLRALERHGLVGRARRHPGGVDRRVR